MRGPRRGTVDSHAESNGLRIRTRPHDKAQISRVEAIHDFSVSACKQALFSADLPVAFKSPRVEGELSGSSISAHLVIEGAFGRTKALSLLVADIRLFGEQIRVVRRHLRTTPNRRNGSGRSRDLRLTALPQ